MATLKTWIVEGRTANDCFSSGVKYRGFDTYEAAETSAKQRASKDQVDVKIFESIAVAKAIVPAIEIEKL